MLSLYADYLWYEQLFKELNTFYLMKQQEQIRLVKLNGDVFIS